MDMFINLSGDIEENSRHFLWQSLMDGLGIIMMEDIAPGSAPLQELVGSAIMLIRTEQKPHRTSIYEGLLEIFPKRRDDLEKSWSRVNNQEISNMAEYESISVGTWAAMKAGVPEAFNFMDALIERGWKLTGAANPNDPYSRFCFFLTAAADSPAKIKARDYWAFRAFEPIAAVGTQVAVHLGIVLEDEIS
jgi:hypothetical protein